jgi:hypothetical protein
MKTIKQIMEKYFKERCPDTREFFESEIKELLEGLRLEKRKEETFECHLGDIEEYGREYNIAVDELNRKIDEILLDK